MNFFRKIYKITSWMLPSKQQRLHYKDICTYYDLRKDIEHTHENYKKVVERLKNKKDKIKVVFLIRENQKWTYQSLYEEFEKSDRFEPLVLVSILTLVAKGKDKTRNNLEENYKFFKSRGMNVDYAYKDGKYINLENFKPDIVFYDQPWDLPELHLPQNVSHFALTCYSSYSYELINAREHYLSEFHKFLYKIFVDNELNLKRYETYLKGNSSNCVVTGYLKMDEYLNLSQSNDVWKNKNKFKIIYAPHHSLEKNGIHFATFLQNGKFILALAKLHPETEWVFKPHPRLKYALLRNKIMSEVEINNYFNEWAKIGSVYDRGDYFDIFRTSDLMITDSISFLAEYLPTGKPIIRLINKKSASLNPLGIRISNACYSVQNVEDLNKIFNNIVCERNDYKKNNRINISKEIFNLNVNVSKKICKKILI